MKDSHTCRPASEAQAVQRFEGCFALDVFEKGTRMVRDARGGFSDVDQTPDPGSFVQYLDTVTEQEFAREFKRQSYNRLGVSTERRILDVGCGTGDDVRAIGLLVGPTGWVVGVDNSQVMIAEVRRRSVGLQLPVEFRVGNAHHLDFDDNSFDGCRADRTFQHLADPQKALSEMVRVARPGGRVAVLDPDWETFVVDHPDRSLTRKILNAYCDRHANGWSGRRLNGLFRRLGLTNVGIVSATFVLTDFPLAIQLYSLQEAVERAEQRGVISRDEGTAWLAQLEEMHRAGLFFSAVTGFEVVGTKP